MYRIRRLVKRPHLRQRGLMRMPVSLARGFSRALAACALPVLIPFTALATAAPGKVASVAFVAPEIPGESVKFCHLPFLDHTQAIIGIKNGWFKDVGISIEPGPNGVVILPSQRAAAHANGQCEISSGATSATIALHKQMPDLVMFVAGDIFEGYAILARPGTKYKTYQEFVKEGVNSTEATKRAIAQMRGKRWAVALDPATQFASNLFLGLANLATSALTIVSVDDAKTVELIIAGQADFQIGGAPSRLELQGKGFYPIITIRDLVSLAKPSVDSPILRAVFPDGWLISRNVWSKTPNVVLRMASVMWRITDFIVRHPKDALAINVPFLNSVSGRTITEEEGMRIYKDLDPFLTFRDSAKLFDDAQFPLYWRWELGAKIKAQVEAGVYKPDELKPEDLTIAPQVYEQMVSLKRDSDGLFTKAGQVLHAIETKGIDDSGARTALSKARSLYAAFDFLDAKRFLEAITSWVNKVGSQ